MHKSLLILMLLLAPLLTACNAYHPLKDGVGFTEVPIGPDSFRITYASDGDISVAQARQFALIRAAELAALRDAPFFQITDEHIFITYAQHYYPGTDTRYVEGFGRRGRVFIHHVYDPGYVQTYTLPEVQLQIQILREPTPATIPAAYLLRQALANKVELSPGVAERLSQLPDPGTTVTIPPPPNPTTAPAQ